jgi:hypothetical protein
MARRIAVCQSVGHPHGFAGKTNTFVCFVVGTEVIPFSMTLHRKTRLFFGYLSVGKPRKL